MNRAELEQKDKKELIALGASVGFALTPATSKVDMIDQLLGLPPAPEPNLPAEGKLRSLDGQLVDAPKVKIMIMATETERDDAKLGLNGHMLQIQRGVAVEIPAPYLGVLNDSTIDTFIQNPETRQITRVQIQRYPYIRL